ncbi:MAG: amino acid ABC transporter substrate-binding protein [Gammaproteobacteria bacterium]
MSPSFLARLPLILALLAVPGASLVAQGTLERVADRGEFRIGYRTDARPLSYEENGQAAGYSVDFCRRIAAAVREHLGLADMQVTFVPLTTENRIDAVVDGDVDIECGSTTVTLGRQELVDFTLMTFVTGGTVLSMAANRVANMSDLAGRRVAVIGSTSTAVSLRTHLSENLIDAQVVMVADRSEGMAQLENGEVDGFASDQIVLVGEAMQAIARDPSLSYSFADELFSFEPYAMMVQRDDADFRLVANRAIAQLFRGGQYAQLYQQWVGSVGIAPSPMLLAMYQVQTLSE